MMNTRKYKSGAYRPKACPLQQSAALSIDEAGQKNYRCWWHGIRFLNSDHIRRLVSGSAKNITNRLKALFEHGYLDRPECQYDYYRPGGGTSFITYALAERGARLLKELENFSSGKRVSWTHKNKNVGRPFLEHTLAIADMAVALKVAEQNHDGLNIIDGDELVSTLSQT